MTLGRSAFTHKGLCRVTSCMDYIQVLEDMLRAYVLGIKGRGEISLNEIRLQQQLSSEYTEGTI